MTNLRRARWFPALAAASAVVVGGVVLTVGAGPALAAVPTIAARPWCGDECHAGSGSDPVDAVDLTAYLSGLMNKLNAVCVDPPTPTWPSEVVHFRGGS